MFSLLLYMIITYIGAIVTSWTFLVLVAQLFLKFNKEINKTWLLLATLNLASLAFFVSGSPYIGFAIGAPVVLEVNLIWGHEIVEFLGLLKKDTKLIKADSEKEKKATESDQEKPYNATFENPALSKYSISKGNSQKPKHLKTNAADRLKLKLTNNSTKLNPMPKLVAEYYGILSPAQDGNYEVKIPAFHNEVVIGSNAQKAIAAAEKFVSDTLDGMDKTDYPDSIKPTNLVDGQVIVRIHYFK